MILLMKDIERVIKINIKKNIKGVIIKDQDRGRRNINIIRQDISIIIIENKIITNSSELMNK